jgi:hypothetical protein
MALTARYFSTADAGAGDATSWADRAILFTGGAWAPEITGFDFSTNGMIAYVGPGTNTVTAALATGSFANPPTMANPLIFVGCDGSGVLLAVPDPDWDSAQAPFDDSTLPVIATTTNIATSSLPNTHYYLIKFTASGRNGTMMSVGSGCTFDWCSFAQNTSHSSASAIETGSVLTLVSNTQIAMTGTAYAVGLGLFTNGSTVYNTRVTGTTGGTGDKHGFRLSGTAFGSFHRCTSVTNGGSGFACTSAVAGSHMRFVRCSSIGNGAAGFLAHSTGSQTASWEARGCLATGNGTYGVNGNSDVARWMVSESRFRDNTSGNITGIGNYPTTLNNYTTDSDDATEFVNSAGGDYRIANDAATWGMGFGAGDEPAAGGGTTIAGTPMRRGMV